MQRVIHTHGLSKKLRPLVCGVLAVVLIVAVSACTAQKGRVNLSPANWAEGELEKYAELGQFRPGSNYLVTGSAGMVTATMGAPAVRAGLEALKQGGSAADAAMVTALAQVALTPGDFITYAGILTMVYYDAATGEVYSMNAAYNAPRDEKDPLSIPAQGSGTPSGRATLVPGFMAGVEAAHKRFGKLPFETLFEPAIYFAQEGFRLDPFRAGLIESHCFRPGFCHPPAASGCAGRSGQSFTGGHKSPDHHARRQTGGRFCMHRGNPSGNDATAGEHPRLWHGSQIRAGCAGVPGSL